MGHDNLVIGPFNLLVRENPWTDLNETWHPMRKKVKVNVCKRMNPSVNPMWTYSKFELLFSVAVEN